MSGVVTGLVSLRLIRAHEALGNLCVITSLYEVSPNTDPLVIIIGQARRALVFRGLAIPTGIEDAAVGGMGENPVKSGAVGGAYRGLQIRPLLAVGAEGIGTVFPQMVHVIEDQAISAEFKGRSSVFTGIVLVTAFVVRKKPEAFGALKVRPGSDGGRGWGLCPGLTLGLGLVLEVLVELWVLPLTGCPRYEESDEESKSPHHDAD
jgi:hypothetical protein